MARRLIQLPAWAAVALLFTSSGASAQVRIPSVYDYIENRQEAGAFVGRLWMARGSLELGPGPGNYAGGRYGIELAGPIFAEGALSYLPTTRMIIDPRRAEGDRSIGEADVDLLLIDARLGFSLTGRKTWRRISPLLFASGGVAIDLAASSPAEELLLEEDRYSFGTGFTTEFGAGLRALATQSLMFRADGGVRLWQLNTPSGFDAEGKSPDLEAVPQSEWAGGLSASFAVTWRF